MRQMNKYTLNVRRESLLKSIRSQQREQFKADRRATLLEHHARARQADEIYRFRLALFTLNLSNEQGRVLQVPPYPCSSSATCRSAQSARNKAS